MHTKLKFMGSAVWVKKEMTLLSRIYKYNSPEERMVKPISLKHLSAGSRSSKKLCSFGEHQVWGSWFQPFFFFCSESNPLGNHWLLGQLGSQGHPARKWEWALDPETPEPESPRGDVSHGWKHSLSAQHPHPTAPEFGTNGQNQVPQGELRPLALIPSSWPDVSPSLGQHGLILPGEVWVCVTQTNTAPWSHLPQKNVSSWDPGKQLQEKTEALPVRHKEEGKGSRRERTQGPGPGLPGRAPARPRACQPRGRGFSKRGFSEPSRCLKAILKHAGLEHASQN